MTSFESVCDFCHGFGHSAIDCPQSTENMAPKEQKRYDSPAMCAHCGKKHYTWEHADIVSDVGDDVSFESRCGACNRPGHHISDCPESAS